MRSLVVIILVSLAVTYTAAQFEEKENWSLSPQNAIFNPNNNKHQFRREADPQGSVVLKGEQPLGGPDRRPSLDLDYRHQINPHTDVYGGAHYKQGERIQPHAGIGYERNFGNGFVRGHGQVQPDHRGRVSPSFGVSTGFRFRREADPQGSVVLKGEQPLGGPDRRPSLDLDYRHQINPHTDVYGGAHYKQGERIQPHAGIGYERNFGNGFVRGHGQVQPDHRGRVSPSFGVSTGFRFRREANPQGSVVLKGEQPLGGPDRRPSLDLDYRHQINPHTDVYGGAHYKQGERIQPHAGIGYERNFGNGFVRGHGQVQPDHRGRVSPSFGVSTGFRFRREADPQGSVVLKGEQPLGGPDRRPSLDLDYRHQINPHTDVYGGAHYKQGERIQPHAGIGYERNFGNGFVRGHGQVQPDHRGRVSPSFGVSTGFRFRREADPQGSVVLKGEQPLGGPDRRPSLDLDYRHQINPHTDVYGGAHYKQGERIQPHAGIGYERNFGNGFVRGHGQVQPDHRGRVSPSFGVSTGFRFRREANPQGSVVLKGEQPLGGPDRRPSLDLDYRHQINPHTDVYGGAHYKQGERIQPHAGIGYERNFGNGFVRGHGQVQPDHRGRVSPSFGVSTGFRF